MQRDQLAASSSAITQEQQGSCLPGEAVSVEEKVRDRRAKLEKEGKEAVTQRSLFELIEAQKYRCALTGIALKPEDAALDHCVPVSIGGEHVISNVQWVSAEVNTMKGQLTTERFVTLCRLVAAHADCDPTPP